MTLRTLIAFAVGLVPAVSVAQDRVETLDQYEYDQYANTLAIGAGALGFMERGFNPQNPFAPMWSVRYGWNPDPAVTWEWSYLGMTDYFRNPDFPLIATLFETGLKLNMGPEAPMYPIIGFGIGYMAFDGTPGETNFDMMTVPILAGLEVASGGLLVSARATWRPTFFDDGLDFSSIGADSWAVTADIGTRF